MARDGTVQLSLETFVNLGVAHTFENVFRLCNSPARSVDFDKLRSVVIVEKFGDITQYIVVQDIEWRHDERCDGCTFFDGGGKWIYTIDFVSIKHVGNMIVSIHRVSTRH